MGNETVKRDTRIGNGIIPKTHYCFYVLPFPKLDAFKFGISTNVLQRVSTHLSDYDKEIAKNGMVVFLENEEQCRSVEAAIKRFYRNKIREFTSNSTKACLQKKTEVLPLSELNSFQTRLYNILMGEFEQIRNPLDLLSLIEKQAQAEKRVSTIEGAQTPPDDADNEISKDIYIHSASTPSASSDSKLIEPHFGQNILLNNRLEEIFNDAAAEVSIEHPSLPCDDPGQRYFDVTFTEASHVRPRFTREGRLFKSHQRSKKGSLHVEWGYIIRQLQQAGVPSYSLTFPRHGRTIDKRRFFISASSVSTPADSSDTSEVANLKELKNRFYTLCMGAQQTLPSCRLDIPQKEVVFTPDNLSAMRRIFEMPICHPDPTYGRLSECKNAMEYTIYFAEEIVQKLVRNEMDLIRDIVSDRSGIHLHLRSYLNIHNCTLKSMLDHNRHSPFLFCDSTIWYGGVNLNFRHDIRGYDKEIIMSKAYLAEHGKILLDAIDTALSAPLVDGRMYLPKTAESPAACCAGVCQH